MQDNLKILHVVTSLGAGGAEGMLYRLIKASRNPMEHSVICLDKGGKYVSLLREVGIDVLVVNFKLTFLPIGLIKIYNFSREKRKQGYKIITSWLYHADFVAWFINIICGFNALTWNIRNSRLQKGRPSIKNWFFLKILSKLSYFRVNKIISCSGSAGEIHKNIGYRKDIFKIIPNGYFLDGSKKFDKKVKDYDGIFRICMVARWHPKKDFKNLFKALSLFKLNNILFHLTIAGNNTGPDNKELVDLLRYYDIEKFCSLLGEVENVQNVYLKSHVTVLSSSYGEGFPNVLVESMSNFTPCISTDVGEAAMILSEVGFVIPVENSTALKDALSEYLRILKDENDVYLNYCLKGFKKISREYDIKYISNKYQNLWESLV